MALVAKAIPTTQTQRCHMLHLVACLAIILRIHLLKLRVELAMEGWGHIRRMVLKVTHIVVGVNTPRIMKINLHKALTECQGEGEGISLDHQGVLPKIQGGPSSIVTTEKTPGGSRCSYFTFQMT